MAQGEKRTLPTVRDTNPKRKRGEPILPSSLALRVGMGARIVQSNRTGGSVGEAFRSVKGSRLVGCAISRQNVVHGGFRTTSRFLAAAQASLSAVGDRLVGRGGGHLVRSVLAVAACRMGDVGGRRIAAVGRGDDLVRQDGCSWSVSKSWSSLCEALTPCPSPIGRGEIVPLCDALTPCPSPIG
jgi:hypothetical protein